MAFLGMALARTLRELFLVRLVLGIAGAASTFAFVLAARTSTPAELRRQVAAVQAAMTIGQVVGPLAGAVVAEQIGFRPSFVVGGAMLVGCAALVTWGVDPPAPASEARQRRRTASVREIAVAALIILGGSTQIFFRRGRRRRWSTSRSRR